MFAEVSNTILAALGGANPLVVLWIALLVYFIAGIIKGTLGIGFPTVAVSLLAQFTDARSAILLVIMPMFFTNLWQVWRCGLFLGVIRQIRLLLITMLVLIAVFSQLSSIVSVDLLAAVLGFIVALYALHSLFATPLVLDPAWDKPAQIIAGVSAGVMGGLVSVWAPPILLYLNARQLSKEQFVATAGVILLMGSSVLLFSYQVSGVLSYGLFLCSMLLIVPSLVGFVVGEYLRRSLSAQRFQRVLLWFFFIMGLNLIRRALS